MNDLTLYERLDMMAALHGRMILHAYDPAAPTRACVWCGLCVEGPVSDAYNRHLSSVGQVQMLYSVGGSSAYVCQATARLVDRSYLRCYEVVRGARRD